MASTPFFVYGTLMRGYRNHAAVLERFVERTEVATLAPSARLWHWPERGYPVLELAGSADGSAPQQPHAPGGGGTDALAPVRGELVWVRASVHAEALECLDALEDFYGPNDARNEYERLLVSARADGSEPQCAWVYATHAPPLPRAGEAAPVLVLCGCWRAFLLQTQLTDSADARFASSGNGELRERA